MPQSFHTLGHGLNFWGITGEAAEVVPVLQIRLGETVRVNGNEASGAQSRGLRNGAAFADLCAG